MSDRFPSISPDGERIAASALPSGGRAVQYVGAAIGEWRPEPIAVDASGGVWQTATDLLFTRNKPGDPQDGAVLRWEMVTVHAFQPPGLEGWSCHNGLFAGWTRGDRLKSRTVSRGGHVAGTVDLGRDVILEVDGAEIDRGPIAEPRYTGEALVWVRWVDGVRRIFGRKHHGAPTENLSWPLDDEFWPLAVETSLGLYVLTHGHPEKGRPLWLRPWGEGQTHGHVVAHGFSDRPDARALERGLVLVAFSNMRELQRVHVNLTAPLEDVRGPIVVPPVEPPPTPPVEPPKETPVQLEDKHSDLIIAFERRFGMPGLSKEEGQAWVGKLASTLKARFPDENWGTKRASSSRPLSNESIARPANGRLWGYDLIIGAGAPGQRLEPHAHAEDITDQVFVAVESRDWLAGSQPPQPNPNPTPTPRPPAFTFPTGVEMPEDVALSVIDGYLEGIRERDKIRAQDVVPSRGALMYLFAVFFRELSTWIVEQKRAPQGAEWWGVRDRIAAAAVKHYQDRQGVD
jgi:hypothetical protein